MLLLIILLFVGVAIAVNIVLDILGLASFHLRALLNKIFGFKGKSSSKEKTGKTTVRTESAVNKGKKKIQADQGEYIDYTNV